jgi:hypothetical protein
MQVIPLTAHETTPTGRLPRNTILLLRTMHTPRGD